MTSTPETRLQRLQDEGYKFVAVPPDSNQQEIDVSADVESLISHDEGGKPNG